MKSRLRIAQSNPNVTACHKTTAKILLENKLEGSVSGAKQADMHINNPAKSRIDPEPKTQTSAMVALSRPWTTAARLFRK